jgi:hypothetical protein
MNELDVQEIALHESILRCLEIIQRTEERIMSHKKWENPDKLALLQFSELKDRYTKELITLLSKAGVKVQLAQAA